MKIYRHGELISDNDAGYEKPRNPYEITQMPTKEVLERFLAGMLGGEATVTFNAEEGVFEDHV